MTKKLKLDTVAHGNGCHWRQISCRILLKLSYRRQTYIDTFVQKGITKQIPVANMEVVDLEKTSVGDTMEHGIYDTTEQTAEPDTNGEVTQDEVDKFPQNNWQFSDEGKRRESGKLQNV